MRKNKLLLLLALLMTAATGAWATPVAPGTVKITAYTDTENVRQGDYIFITVVGKSLVVSSVALDQSLAE